jgi:uncharacterized membrane protein YdjX (TVP38/TMEM64 family)
VGRRPKTLTPGPGEHHSGAFVDVVVSHRALRRVLVGAWLVVVASGLFLFVFHRQALQQSLTSASSTSLAAGAALYLAFGCLRGFTLIPSTTLVLAAVPFFPPTPLFVLTLAGIVISSASIYRFSEALHLDDLFESLHAERLARLKTAIARYELPVIIVWSFFPLAPTDLICYACGVIGVRLRTCLVGVAIGEGAICGTYIYFGDWVLRALHWRG